MKLPQPVQAFTAFDQRFANCDKCELNESCSRGQFALATGPLKGKKFNGIFVVGEFAGQQEVSAKRPFVGRPGQLLRSLLRSAGIDMDECYLSNALLAKPPSGEGSFTDRFPNAVYSCLPRLEKEIEHVRPRVIIALGPAAFKALTGYEESVQKKVRFECEGGCNEKRQIGPLFQCGKCKATFEEEVATCVDCGLDQWPSPSGITCDNGHGGAPSVMVLRPPPVCPWCNAKTNKLKPKMIKCPTCGGRKTRETTVTTFEHDYTLKEVAGMVVPGEKFGWSEFGVKYIIPTFHPSFLLIPTKSEGSGEKKVMAGQFAAYAVQKHFEKARVLSKEDRDWAFEYDLTAGDDDVAAQRVYDFVADVLKTSEYELGADVETEAYGCAHYCDVCEKKSRETKDLTFLEDSRFTSEEVCPNCKQITLHTLEKCELDARELEDVTRIKCIGFASRVLRRVLVVDTREMRFASPLWHALEWLLDKEPELGKVFHHGTYDVPVIWKLWKIQCLGYTTDTLIKHHETHADETHDLAHLAARYTYAPLWKPPKKKRGAVIHESFDELVLYNARDCMVTSEASHALDIELKREKMQALHEMDMKLQVHGLAMQQNGLPLDMEAARVVGQEAFEKRTAAVAELRKVLGAGCNYPCARKSCKKCKGTGVDRTTQEPCTMPFNPNSPEHVRDLFYVKLGNAIGDWTSGGKTKKNKKPSTAKEAIVKLTDGPAKRAYLEYLETNAIIKAFFEISPAGELDEFGEPVYLAEPGRSLNLWDDGRVHVKWKPFGTITGRFSSSPNMQNCPKWFRAMFKCKPGRKIVGADYDQLELRTLGVLCGDETLIHKCMTADDKRKLEPDFDPHSYVASNVFDHYTSLHLKDPKHNPENKKCKCETCHRKNLRDLCKRVIYGLNYGAGEETVLESIYNGGYYGPPISIADIRNAKKTIFEVFPGILSWRQDMVQMAQDTRELRSVFMGRRREYALGDVPITEIANFPIQSSSADIVNERSILFFDMHKKIDPTALYLAQIHDALYYEVAEEKAAEFAAAMTATLTCEKSFGGSAPMKFSASASIADNMKDAA